MQRPTSICSKDWKKAAISATSTPCANKSKDLFAQPDSRAGGALQVMTIHKAKGLEFDTVILPGLGQRPRVDEVGLLTWSEQEGRMLLAPIAKSGDADELCKYLGHLEKLKNDNETKRLLYVAVTRARDQLHLLGCAKLSSGEPPSAHSGSLLRLLWDFAAPAFLAKARTQPALGFASNGAPPQRIIRRVPMDWEVPEPPPAVFAKLESIGTIEAPDITFEWVGDRLRHVGTVVHIYLQQMAREGLESWKDPGRAAYRPLLATLGVLPSELDTACESVEKALQMAARDPKGRWALKAHAEAESEYPVTGMIDGKVYQAVIDRTFVDEEGVRWIIDFKTSVHAGGDVDKFLDAEQERYREQLERYAHLLAQSESRPIRLGLYFPLLNGWREWAAPVFKRRQASLFQA